MSGSEMLIGYSIRIIEPAQSNSCFLLKEVPQVRSVDKNSWPSLSDSDLNFKEEDFDEANPQIVAIALTVLLTPSLTGSARDYFLQLNIGCPHEVLSSDYCLVGYDVADTTLTSGLSNCAYTEEEENDLSPSFARYLNEFHLFTDTEKAAEFAELTNRRVPEHAPFHVFGIYQRAAKNRT